MRIAAIDIGTNTVQLLVAERAETGLRRLRADEQFIRLGEGVDDSGRIGDAALGRLLDGLETHLQTADAFGVDKTTVAGTSALRDAENRDAVVEAVDTELGLAVEILSGEEEARWSFVAAAAGVENVEGSILVVDIGGGSTELVLGAPPARPPHNPTRRIRDRSSLDLGCVRLTERFIDRHPPSASNVKAVEETIDAALPTTSIDPPPAVTAVGTAGTATALALVHAGPDSTWDALQGSPLSLSQRAVRRWRRRLVGCSVEEIRELHPDAMEGRADVFTVGVILLERILTHYDLSGCRVSPYELRHGLALRRLANDG